MQITSKYFSSTTKFEYSNNFDKKRISKLMGEAVNTKEIIDHCTPNTIVYDIGAAIGTVGLFLAHFCKKVILIEPDPTHLELLKKNVAINEFQNVEVLGVACGNENKTITLYTDHDTAGKCPSCFELGHHKSIQVPMYTLDSLIAIHGEPDIIKIDVEGYEMEVLQGMSSNPRWLFLELHPEHCKKDPKVLLSEITDLLASRYSMTRYYPRGTEYLSVWKSTLS